MLIAGPTSSCDVCLEPFGRDTKTPCSISCGHVFCLECLDNICPPTCPLCRKTFDPYLTVRLHIDLDSVKPPSSPESSSDTPNEEEDAKRIYNAITKIATEGCSESHIRGVISEGKTFLNGKPRDSFKDLRTIFRLMSYLTEVKSNLRASRQQNQDIARQHKALMEEREALLVKMKAQAKKREQEQKQALDVELNLREHCSKAHEAYERMVDQYNYVAKEWSRMNDEIKKLRTTRNGERTAPGSPSYVDYHYSPSKLDQDSLLGAALREGNSILISPLPEFTTKNSAFKPLPRVDEGEEEEEEESYDGSEEYDEGDSSDADILDAIMDIVKSPLVVADVPRGSSSDETAKRPQSAERASPERHIAIDQPATSPPKDFFHVPNPSGLSRTAPYAEVERGGRARSHSIPSDGSGRGSGSSRPSSRSVSPARPSASSSRTRLPAQPSQSSLVPYQASSQSIPRSTPSPQAQPVNDGLRTRLYDILGDRSSSPPQSSASMALARVVPRRSPSRSPSPSSSDSRHQPRQTRSPFDRNANNAEQIPRLLHGNASSGSGAPPSTSPNPRTSSASEAARALERSKRERQQQQADRERRLAVERSSPERELDLPPQAQRAVHPPMLPSTWVSASSMASSNHHSRHPSGSSASTKPAAAASGPQTPTHQLPYSQPYQPHQPSTRANPSAKPYTTNHRPYAGHQPGLYA